MRKEIHSFILTCLILLSSALAAQESGNSADSPRELPPFDTVVSEEFTLDRVFAHVQSGRVSGIPKDKYLMIEGVVSSRQVIQGEEENFFGILEISSGAWQDGEDLEMYKCYFQLRGKEFYGTIPEGRSRETSSREITLHSHLIAVGRYLGYGEDAEGNRFPVFEAVKIRKLRM